MSESIGMIQQTNQSDIEFHRNTLQLNRKVGGRYEEPVTHQTNKSVNETLFGSCLKQQLNLSKTEIQALGELREDCSDLFDQTNQTHLMILGELWNVLTGYQMDKLNFKSEEWIKYGFQNKNPTTDFRGGGVQSLLQLIKFVKKNEDLVQREMVNPINDFFFAISSINVTFFLKVYLHLAEHLDPKHDKSIYCNRRSLKTFCTLLNKDSHAFDCIHELLLKDMYQSWIILRKNQPETSLLDFPKIEVQFKAKFKNILRQQPWQNVSQIIEAYQTQQVSVFC